MPGPIRRSIPADNVTAAILVASGTINLNAAVSTRVTLYTVPASKEFILTRITLRKPSGTVANVLLSFSYNAGAGSIMAKRKLSSYAFATAVMLDLSSFDNVTSGRTFIQDTNRRLFQPADTIESFLDAPAGSALTCMFDIFGYLTTSGVPDSNVKG